MLSKATELEAELDGDLALPRLGCNLSPMPCTSCHACHLILYLRMGLSSGDPHKGRSLRPGIQ